MGAVPEMSFMGRGIVLAPVHLFPLLEIYCSPARESCPHLTRGSGNVPALLELHKLGLVEELRQAPGEDHGWRITEKGQAYVGALLRVPLPVQIWSIPV